MLFPTIVFHVLRTGRAKSMGHSNKSCIQKTWKLFSSSQRNFGEQQQSHVGRHQKTGSLPVVDVQRNPVFELHPCLCVRGEHQVPSPIRKRPRKSVNKQ